MKYLLLVLKGMAMGAADVVPGVSGGTLAFILGIYPRLLAALKSIDVAAVRLVLRGQIREAWQQIDGTFLLAVFGGVLLSIFGLARLVKLLMETQPILLWAFFNGLILASLPMLIRSLKWQPKYFALLLLGMGFALAINQLAAAQVDPAWYLFFLAGFIAVSAMILPGISGSFILIILGMYGPVLAAVTELQIGTLLLILLGCILGLLCCSHLLTWLLKRYYEGTLATLIGIVLGALVKIWPWQTDWQSDANVYYWPWQQPQTSQWFYALLCFVVGVGVIGLLQWLDKRLSR